MDDVLKCPIHAEKLKISSGVISVLGMNYSMILGECSRCRVIYTDQTIHGIGKFTYRNKLYQYLPQLEQWRVEQQQKLEEKRKNNEEKKKLEEKFPFLKSGSIKIRIAPSKSKRCPEHGDKLSGLVCKLMDDANVELMTLNGIYCKKCGSMYLNPDLQEKMKLYANKVGLKIKVCGNISAQKLQIVHVLKIQFPQKKLQGENKKLETKNRKEYPFLKCKKIKIGTIPRKSSICPTHQKKLVTSFWVLKKSKEALKYGFEGFYCPDCNCVYQSGTVEKWMERMKLSTENEIGDYTIELRDNTRKKKKTISNVVPVSEFEFLKDREMQDNEKRTNIAKVHEIDENQRFFDEAYFKLVAYRKFEKEIAEVDAYVDGDERYIRILTSVSEEDKRRCVPEDMLIREAETLGREILGRIAHNQLDTFYAKDHGISILQYEIWPGQEHHLDGFTKFSNPEKMQDITIMSQKNLDRDSEEYEMVTALVYCANRDVPVYIDVYYSKHQNKYFINDESYRQYSARYGLPYIRLVPGEYNGNMNYGNLRQYSELNLYGYTVAKTADMVTGTRQKLLRQLMDNGLMSKHQIVNHLEWLIHRQSGRISMEDACDCWKEDLRFVNDYKIDQQRRICGKFVYGKTALR